MRAAATIRNCLDLGAARLEAAGVEAPRREARLLLAHALGGEASRISGNPEDAVADMDPYLGLIVRRAEREPLSHLTGRREFWSLDFQVGAAALDPRPDSEVVVEPALAALKDGPASARIADFGTGTGCLLLSILSERPGDTGVGLDLSLAAVDLARENARRLDLADRTAFAVSDWGSALGAGKGGRFDLIVANPPYIPSGEIDGLQPEVARYDPRLALDGGNDGLDAYRALAPDLGRLLASGGVGVLEIGAGQGAAVRGILGDSGLAIDGSGWDLGGIERCLVCRP